MTDPIYDKDPGIARRQRAACDKNKTLKHNIVRAQNIGPGKGDLRRMCDEKKYRANYDLIKWRHDATNKNN